MVRRRWSWGVICWMIALAPVCAGAIWMVGESMLTPGDCANMGGVMCYSQMLMLIIPLYSFPAGLLLWCSKFLLDGAVWLGRKLAVGLHWRE